MIADELELRSPEGPRVPDVVIEAVRDTWWRNEAWQGVLREMRWSPLCRCWFIERYDMTIGIELDGYIHS